MKSFLLFGCFFTRIAAFSLTAYDLGLHGLYPRQHFHSVDLEPPDPKVTRWDSRCDPGNILLAPRGPLVTGAARGPVILDPKGNLIWMDNTQFKQAMNFNVQKYKGQDYLTFWTKEKKDKKKKKSYKDLSISKKTPSKSYVMLNSSYEVAYRIYPYGKHLKADSHEFRITPHGTALIIIYYKHQADCTALNLGKQCWITDGLFQEINIETGELIFEWKATDHISMTDVFSSPNMKDGYGTSKEDSFDYFHINSVDVNDDGDYLVSARYLHAVLCISRKTGETLWQLGGKKNDFKDLDEATDFKWQHHVTWQGNDTISLYDNYANTVLHRPSKHSDGMLIRLNMENMTASLIHRYIHPDRILSVSQGSVQVLPESGNILVGFGNSPTFVEYTHSGDVLCSTRFAPQIAYEIIDFGLVKSYRIFKQKWVGRPRTVPDVKVKAKKLYVSWNGATEVKKWRLERTTVGVKSEGEGDFVTVQEYEREGFETSFELDGREGGVRVVALDAESEVLAASVVVSVVASSHFLLYTLLSISGLFAVAILLYRISAHVPRLKDFRDLRSRWFARAKINKDYDSDYDSESSPLMLNDRDV